jgi:hypothetical protein
MQFYSTVAVVALSLSATVSAAPAAEIQERQTNTINTITTSLNTLRTALNTDQQALSKYSNNLVQSQLTYFP